MSISDTALPSAKKRDLSTRLAGLLIGFGVAILALVVYGVFGTLYGHEIGRMAFYAYIGIVVASGLITVGIAIMVTVWKNDRP